MQESLAFQNRLCLVDEVPLAAARGKIMDRASIVILERTLELATELMPDDVRVANCMDAIRQYVESPDVVSERKLHHAVTELLTTARQHQQFLIAARCQAFVRQFKGSPDAS